MSDIQDIADYTIEKWGREQARSYVATLRLDIESLTKFSQRYPEHKESGLGLRRMNSGHHLVFSIVKSETIEIVRILHERMDVDGLFG